MDTSATAIVGRWQSCRSYMYVAVTWWSLKCCISVSFRNFRT